MRSTAIINQKGGVGKTTTAVNLGAALARLGQRVCILDLDPQAHASLHLGVTVGEGEPTMYDVLTRGAALGDVRRPVGDNLWLLPAHLDLAAVELELANRPRRESILRDQLAVDPAGFDHLIIDCPPSLGVLTLNALTAVQEILLPLQPHFLALHGLSKLLGTIDVVAQRMNPQLRLTGVVLCMYDSGTRLAAEVSRDVEAFFASQGSGSAWAETVVFQTRIRRNIRLAEAPSHSQSIFQYSANSYGSEDYQGLADEFLALARREQRSAA